MKTYRRPLVGIEIAPHGPYTFWMVVDALEQAFLKKDRSSASGYVVYVTESQIKKVVDVMCKSTPGVSFRQLETVIVDKQGRRGVVKGYVKKNGKQAARVLWDGPPKKKKIKSAKAEFLIEKYNPWQCIELWRLGVNKDNQYFVKNISSKKPPPPKEKSVPIVLDRWDLVI